MSISVINIMSGAIYSQSSTFFSSMNRILTRSKTSSAGYMVKVVHDSSKSIFRAILQEEEVGHLQYRMLNQNSSKSVDFFHTHTNPVAQGRGVAARMVQNGLQWAKDNNLRVIPSCSYVASYIDKNPQWKSSL